MKRIDPADLSIFIAIANHLSFSRAAVELGVTPSSLSHALRTVEERLGVRLVNRTTRSVALTEAGQRLYARIKPAFLDINDALDDLNSFRDTPAGTLRFNASRVAAKVALLPAAIRFQRRYPDVNVEIVVDNAMIDIVAAGFDAGVRLGETIEADMITTALGPRHRFAVVATPDYFARYPVPATPEDLRGQPCIRYRFLSGAIYRWEFERGGIELDVEVDGPMTVSDQDIMLDAALGGAGLAYLFEDQVRDHIADGRLVRVLEDWCPFYPGFYLYYPSRRQAPAALRAFLDFVRSPDWRQVTPPPR
jgi:DNA-binding transcriptional LysR family regulator